jgi:hypothetical protein
MKGVTYFPRTLLVISIFFLAGSTLVTHAASPQQTGEPPRPIQREEGLPHLQMDVVSPALPTSNLATTSLLPRSGVVYQSFRNSNWEIYLASDDGASQWRLNGSITLLLYDSAGRRQARMS